MLIILLGPPGVGKGTQAKVLAERYDLKHISTGDILRSEINEKTELGKKAQSILAAGQLVPDDIMIKLIEKVLITKNNSNGFVLDGFPRTTTQAEALEKLLERNKIKIDFIIYIDVSENEIIKRLKNRYSCNKCGRIFNYEFNGNISMKCKNCGGTLLQREDDKPQTVLSRLKVYNELTEPVKHFYQKNSKYFIVDGSDDIDSVNKKVIKIIEESNCLSGSK